MHFDYSIPSASDPSIDPAHDTYSIDHALTQVAARIVHDIVNPLGAIANGLELLELSGFPKTEEFKLMEHSVQNAQERIKVMRLAFGPIKTDSIMPVHQLNDILCLIFPAPRYTLKFNMDEDITQSHARLITLLALCAADAIPFGGTVILSDSTLRIEHETRVNLGLFDPSDAADNIDPTTLHFHFARQILADQNHELDVRPLKNGAEISIPAPPR